ncbi:hypothetical protein TrLO_g8454 [Triparma laevis f. longispina]|uniref:RRM domain-containing protein n=1 Tax=Triparma laevis f. longispina TaxID=1714387 RepID=A0A9W7C667_9STRA|nr:hypothetical protein TrLO_g8454 [Triparma laevis f. longispina]
MFGIGNNNANPNNNIANKSQNANAAPPPVSELGGKEFEGQEQHGEGEKGQQQNGGHGNVDQGNVQQQVEMMSPHMMLPPHMQFQQQQQLQMMMQHQNGQPPFPVPASEGMGQIQGGPRGHDGPHGLHGGGGGGSNGHSFVTGNFDPLEAVLGVFPAVRIRGLPFTATLEDVLMFFQGLVVVDVVLDKVKNEGVVLFANPMDFQMALGRDKQHMGRRYIEVFQGKRIEYYNAIVSAQHITAQQRGQPLFSHQHQGRGGYNNYNRRPNNSAPPLPVVGQKITDHTGILRMRGLPFSATVPDIVKFFASGSPPAEETAIMGFRPDGRLTGEAFVIFNTPEESHAAMVGLNRHILGNRYIELFVSNKEEYELCQQQGKATQAQNLQRPTGSPNVNGGGVGVNPNGVGNGAGALN